MLGFKKKANRFLAKKEKRALDHRGDTCLNCAHPLDISDRFCAFCGQKNFNGKLSLGMLIEEWLGSIISYDSRLWRSLRTLLFKPGKITREFLDGKRSSYTNPFRFMLSLSFIYFLLVSLGGGLITLPEDSRDEAFEIPLQDTLSFGKYAKLWSTPSIGTENKESDSLVRYSDSLRLHREFGDRVMDYGYFLTKDTLVTYEDINKKYRLEDTTSNNFAFRIARSLHRISKDPSAFINQFINRLPFLIFFFIPVFALFIWLLYSKKRYNYMDHLVFSFHLQSAFLLFLILGWALSKFITSLSAEIPAILIFAVYLFIALRRFYRQSRLLTLVKFTLLNIIFFNLALFSVLFWMLFNALIF